MRRGLRRERSGDRGITLLELVIAVFVLALGSMAVLRANDQSRLVIGGVKDRMLAQLAARNRAEELKLLGQAAGLPDTVVIGGQSFALTTDLAVTAGGVVRADVTASAQDGPGAQVVVYISGRVP